MIRDGSPPCPDTGYFGVNIHRGGTSTTSSEGCQTLPPAQWPAFIAAAQDQARRVQGGKWKRVTIPYALIEGAQRAAKLTVGRNDCRCQLTGNKGARSAWKASALP